MTGAPLPPGADPTPPAPPEGLGSGRGDAFRFLVFAVFLGLWTWKLLEPSPVPESLSAQLGGDWKFILAKGLHACAYAFLVVLAHALPVPRYWHWFLIGLLALHGVATEIGQTFVPNRTGSVRDVVIDWVGIALGVLVCHLVRREGERGA